MKTLPPMPRLTTAPTTLSTGAGYIPDLASDAIRHETLSFEAHGQRLDVTLPRLTPSQLETMAASVSAAARAELSVMPIMEIVDAVDRTIARMLDPADTMRQEMERLLPIVSGFHPEMTRLGLNSALKAFRRPQLLRFLVEDFGDPGLLDGFRPRASGGWTRACGPELIGHVWAGNVPGLPLWSLISGLLVKSGNVGKVSSDEPLVASWFARTLEEVEPRLAKAIAIAWWPGGDNDLEEALCRHAEVLKVYGGTRTIASWQRRLPPGRRLLAHGHKFSAGLVSATALDARQSQLTARQAAQDMVRWDQQGCYSPQMFYVERGAQVSPHDFACHLAGELAALQHTFTRRALSLEDTAAVASWRQALELRALRGEPVELMGAADAFYCVAYLDKLQAAPPGALNRTACVVAVNSLDEAVACLRSQRAFLQSVGLAASPEELFRLAPSIARTGATRICAIGSMTSPAAGWHHDGRFSLLDLVSMVDIDQSAELAAEALSGYRD